MTSLMGIVNWPCLLCHVCGGPGGLCLHLSRVLMVGLEHPRVWKVTMVQPSLEVSLVDCWLWLRGIWMESLRMSWKTFDAY